MTRPKRWLKAGCLFLLMACMGPGGRGDEAASAEYLKTLGGHFSGKVPPCRMGRIAVDEQGYLYGGTPGGGSWIQKLTPDGAVVWGHFRNSPGFQAMAVDRKEPYNLYSGGSGYGGCRQVDCFDRETGDAKGCWALQWIKDETVEGVRSVGMPAALAVGESHLFVVDSAKGELRRFDKSSGKEAPFGSPVLVNKALSPQSCEKLL